jgi:NADH:ubiquinone reductase (H+-translocating)
MNVPKRIVILGSGFGGVYTARWLEQNRDGTPPIRVTLVSRNNYFLMTPLLFEAGSGVIEPRHAVNPLRPLFRRTRFIEAEVTGVDFDCRVVTVKPAESESYIIRYDHLVLALGGVTATDLIPGSDNALTFKTLADAIYLRNYVIQCFERADVERDPRRKAALLTIVIVGGGLVAVELAGELREFTANLAKLYPRVNAEDVRLEMLEARPHIAPEFDDELRDYAARTLTRRGVRIRTETRVDRIEEGRVYLADGEVISSETIILATGVVPSPLVASLPLEKDRKGRALTDPTLRCKGRKNIWALGDCASIPDPTGKPYPPLAQHALREARVLAENLVRSMHGHGLQPFVYETKGTLAALGHFKGIGKVKGFRIRGLLAWWVWRTYYLFQMPRWDRRLRVLIDWTVALFFKNDIVQLDLFGTEHPRLRRQICAAEGAEEDGKSRDKTSAERRSASAPRESVAHQEVGVGAGAAPQTAAERVGR